MTQNMLSTLDNPFDPFTQFTEWFTFDHAQGYDTPNLLARIARSSDELSEADQSVAIENAIDEICQENVLGIYIKVTQN